jgi:hypothetical protein
VKKKLKKNLKKLVTVCNILLHSIHLDFCIKELEKKGGFGKIYIVEDERKNKFAMKEIPFETEKEKNLAHQEEEIFKKLSGKSPYLMSLHSAFVDVCGICS